MGGAQYKSETPQQLIPTYIESAGSSGSGSSPEANASLNSSSTNTGSTTSTTRALNKRNKVNDDEVILSVRSTQIRYDQPSHPAYPHSSHSLQHQSQPHQPQFHRNVQQLHQPQSHQNVPQHHQPQSHQNVPQPHQPQSHQNEETEDFLPICDALFNIICLVGYFCDIVFDVLAAYSFYQEGHWEWALVAGGFIITSMIVCQVVSFGWYWTQRGGESEGQGQGQGHEQQACSSSVLIFMHLTFCGVLWRYFKLFIPVDIRFVKSEVRDLCLLRLIHAFVESGPMLLIQLYLTFLKSSPAEVTDLTIVSTTLSLFTLCWALASYSKNIRRQNVHKLVLTWLGVIFQFLWRLGTVTARVTALAVYATVYSYWIFLVLILHWFCMVLWIMSPRNIFSGEKLSGAKKTTYSALVSVVYLLCFINVQEVRSRQKVTIFYVTMFLENTLLVGVWLIGAGGDDLWYRDLVLSIVFGAFVLGILFMVLYYSYFHVRKLSYGIEDPKLLKMSPGAKKPSQECDYYSSVDVKEINNFQRDNFDHGENCHGENYGHGGGGSPYNFQPEAKEKRSGGRGFYNKINGHHIHHPNVPGVFNCRFNPAMKRKKKKPSTFIPPPPAPPPGTPPGTPPGGEAGGEAPPNLYSANSSHAAHAPVHTPAHSAPPHASVLTQNESITFSQSKFTNLGPRQNDSEKVHVQSSVQGGGYGGAQGTRPGKMANPFWKRPQSVPTVINDGDGRSIGSASSSRYRQIDIHQKLQAKKEQQMADLKAIEEEIRQGKLRNRPSSTGMVEGIMGGGSQGPPLGKQPPWFRGGGGQGVIRPPIIIPTGDELIFDPQVLVGQGSVGGPHGFYERVEWNNFYEAVFQPEEDGFRGDVIGESVSDMMNEDEEPEGRRKSRRRRKSPSQAFFPRGQGSLPMDQKFRSGRACPRRMPENSLPSANSSDADVDSGGEDEIYEDMSVAVPSSIHQIRLPHHQHKRFSKQKQPETPL